jgi:hypothetical protein
MSKSYYNLKIHWSANENSVWQAVLLLLKTAAEQILGSGFSLFIPEL